MGLVIEQDSPDGKVIISVSLTAKWARELRRLLREMLEAAGEQVRIISPSRLRYQLDASDAASCRFPAPRLRRAPPPRRPPPRSP